VLASCVNYGFFILPGVCVLAVQGAVANTGEGLYEGLTWIQERISESRKSLKSMQESQEEPAVSPEMKPKPQTWWSSVTSSCTRTSH